MNKNNYVAIMAGGVGSRFWPMSRASFPKQFLDILNTGKTLLQSTFDRYKEFILTDNIYVITSEEYIPIVHSQLPALPEENVIGEPERKNTAPCIAYIAVKLKTINPNANMIVAPSDHLIQDEKNFRQSCLKALDFTQRHKAFVTIGIKPTYANTGYGYIQFDKHTNQNGIFPVKRFTEKPDKATATMFFENGGYLWNAGIFIWKASDVLTAFEAYCPEMHALFTSAPLALKSATDKEKMDYAYGRCASISIDYAIMEKAGNIFVIPGNFRWSDLGTWNSAWDNIEKDISDNAVAGPNTFMIASSGCMVHSQDKKLVVVGGVTDLIIVNTPDALLICNKENEQQIKEYVARIKEVKGDAYL